MFHRKHICLEEPQLIGFIFTRVRFEIEDWIHLYHHSENNSDEGFSVIRLLVLQDIYYIGQLQRQKMEGSLIKQRWNSAMEKGNCWGDNHIDEGLQYWWVIIIDRPKLVTKSLPSLAMQMFLGEISPWPMHNLSNYLVPGRLSDIEQRG